MTTAELLVKCLEQEDVEYIFGVPGEENIDIIHALTQSPIRFITTRHEQGAAFMADVYGRLTGNPGVCLSTLGPGATNLMTGVADANLDGAPLIAITAQVGTDKMHITWHQYLDLVNMFQPVTKWSKQIVRPDITPEVVRKAFKLASREKPGAVHINLPNNIGAMTTEAEPIRKTLTDEKSFAAYGSVEKAAVAISRAANPVILAGNEVIRCNAAGAVLRMAESLQIPVVNTFMGKGIIPFTSRYSMFSVGLNHRMAIDKLFDSSDLVICIGYDFIEYAPKMWNSERNIDVIHIGSHEAEVNKYYQPIVNIIGDISDSITEIIRRSVRTEKPEAAYQLKDELLEEYHSAAVIDSFPMDPRRILYDVRAVLGEDDILISDVGAHKCQLHGIITATDPIPASFQTDSRQWE